MLETQKAAVLDPYTSTGDYGSLYFDREALGTIAIGAAERGYHTTVHSIGDRAVRNALQVAGDLRAAGHETRFITQHTTLVHPADRQLFVDYDVMVQTTGSWALVQPNYADHLAEEVNFTRQVPLRWWEDHGVIVALGSDWPASTGGFDVGVNVFNNIYTAMHRSGPEGLEAVMGTVQNAVLPPEDQVMTLAEAVRAYTLNGAMQMGIDHDVGSIEAGKKADLVILDQNLFEVEARDIPKTKVLSTMFDGRFVYDTLSITE